MQSLNNIKLTHSLFGELWTQACCLQAQQTQFQREPILYMQIIPLSTCSQAFANFNAF